MREPDVSVIIPVFNAMPYLIQCVTSVLEQSIGQDRIEIIAVNDGSTDDSGKQLDEFAATNLNLRVIHQENSGGASRPRNVGLEHATGKYIFFLDADDYLGVEALERVVRMADDYGSDIVLPKLAGVNGRPVARAMFRRTEPRVDLYTSEVYRTLNVFKLFRRDLVGRLGLRFPEDLHIGEDQFFSAPAYFHAKTISVLADYDCYYLRRRDDGENITSRLTDVPRRLDLLERILPLVAEHVDAGPRRDHITRRHFREVANAVFGRSFLNSNRAVQEEAMTRGRALLETWYTPGAARALPAVHRAKLHLVQTGNVDQVVEYVRAWLAGEHGKDVVENGRIYAAYRFFRDPTVRIPDEYFDATDEQKIRHNLTELAWTGNLIRMAGHAYIDHIDIKEPGTELVLRERTTHTEHRFPTHATPTPNLTAEFGEGLYDYGMAGFTASIDPARGNDGQPLPPGRWDVFLSLRMQDVVKEVRFGRNRAAAIDDAPQRQVLAVPDEPGVVATAYFTKPHGNLTFDIGENVHKLSSVLVIDHVSWSRNSGPALLIRGRLDLADPGPLPGLAAKVLLTAKDGRMHEIPVDLGPAPRNGFTATVPLATVAGGRRLPDGQWQVTVEFEVAGLVRQFSGRWPAVQETIRWLRRGRPVTATAASAKSGKSLHLRINTLSIRGAVRRVLAPGWRRLPGR
ncbi:MAG TPA: glycosyltransferase [Micromonospora sp.]|nr:glycosyltransferase [Micromonospora sp.]